MLYSQIALMTREGKKIAMITRLFFSLLLAAT